MSYLSLKVTRVSGRAGTEIQVCRESLTACLASPHISIFMNMFILYLRFTYALKCLGFNLPSLGFLLFPRPAPPFLTSLYTFGSDTPALFVGTDVSSEGTFTLHLAERPFSPHAKLLFGRCSARASALLSCSPVPSKAQQSGGGLPCPPAHSASSLLIILPPCGLKSRPEWALFCSLISVCLIL